MLKVKLGRPAVNHMLQCVALLGRRINPSVVKVVITTLAFYHRLYKHGGIRFLVIYLKACSSMLQQAIGGQRLHDLKPFGARVGRTHSGYPSCIPALHRARIRHGCTWTIRFWATLFGIYRVLEFPGTVKIKTITAECGMDPLLSYQFSQFVTTHFIKVLRSRFHKEGTVTDALWSSEGEGPLEFMKSLRASPFLISKSGPAVLPGNVPVGAQSTSPASILASAHTWLHSPLFPVLQNWCKMTGNHWVLNRISSWAKELWVWEDAYALSPGTPGGKTCPFEATNWLGKLGFKQEPAGKVRVFAMVDPWTQWLMDTLHRAIFGLLSVIPQDGTFDQLKPIHRLVQWQESNRSSNGRLPPLYSFDLSAATDRIPLVLQKILLSPFLTAWGAELWGTLMVGRKYHAPKTISFGKGQPKQVVASEGYVRYATGQPMGALSSWAMLAFIHHAFVQWSALRAGVITVGTGWYEGYAILGDDVVIAGSAVAKRYAALMQSMDVGIGDHKSLVSESGVALEFAKRTFLNGVDVSMVPFAEFVAGRQSLAGILELVRKYSLSFGSVMTVLGYGYKAKASASKRLFSMPKRLRNYILAFYGPNGPAYQGLRYWLPMKSVTSTYTSVNRVSALVTSFFETEVKLALELLDSMLPLITEAKRLGTVSRDREHYGTAPRGADRRTVTGGIEKTTPHEVVDSLNETVYREAFLDAVIAHRDLRTKLEELQVSSLDWEGLEAIWSDIRAIETDLAALPLPRNYQTRPSGEKSLAGREGRILKRWYRHSGTFRATVDPVGTDNLSP
nr:MAG: RNA dependent RNA polymerase [Mitoviridae sp.]